MATSTTAVIAALKVLQDAELTLSVARDNLPDKAIQEAKGTLGVWFTSQFKANLTKGAESFKVSVGKLEETAKKGEGINKLPAAFRQYKSDCKRAIIKARDMGLEKEAKALKGISAIKKFSLEHAGDGDATAAMVRLQKAKTAVLKGLKGSARGVTDAKIAAILDKAVLEVNKLADSSKTAKPKRTTRKPKRASVKVAATQPATQGTAKAA